MSGRCKLCDKPLEPYEIIWNEDKGEHEEWCSRCRKPETEEDYEDLSHLYCDAGIIEYE